MIVIKPQALTPAMISASSLVNADPNWVSSTTYAAGAKVTYANRIWLSSQSANSGNVPGAVASTAWWADQGPSNTSALIDDEVATVSTAVGEITLTISGVSANAIAVHNMTATSMSVTAKKDGVIYYQSTNNLWDTSVINDWEELWFNEPEFISDMALTDIPMLPNTDFTLTFSNPAGTVSVGKIVIGKRIEVGKDQYGIRRDGVDYTTVTFDKFDKVKIGEQRYVKKLGGQAQVPNRLLDSVVKKLDSVASTRVTVVAANGIFKSMIVHGLMTFYLDLKFPTYHEIAFEVKGTI